MSPATSNRTSRIASGLIVVGSVFALIAAVPSTANAARQAKTRVVYATTVEEARLELTEAISLASLAKTMEQANPDSPGARKAVLEATKRIEVARTNLAAALRNNR